MRKTLLRCAGIVLVALSACGREPVALVAASPASVPVALPPPSASASAVRAASAPVAAPLLACRKNAEWDGLRCAPKRLDCPAGTTWNGGWCLDPSVERLAATDFARVDAEIQKLFAPDEPGFEYSGYVTDIIGEVSRTGELKPGRYQRDLANAEHYDAALANVISAYASPLWRATGLARQATLYDGLWLGLREADAPRVMYFTPTQIALLNRLSQPGRGGLQNQANDLLEAVKAGFQRKRNALLEDASRNAVSRYAAAVVLARFYGFTSPQIAHAIERLRSLTDELGDEKMSNYVTATLDPSDFEGGSRLTYVPGMYK